MSIATLGGQEMLIVRVFRLLYGLLTDHEVYFLAWLAFRNLFRKTKTPPKFVAEARKAKAKAAD